MLEVTNQACDCVGRKNEVQAGLAEQAQKVLCFSVSVHLPHVEWGDRQALWWEAGDQSSRS